MLYNNHVINNNRELPVLSTSPNSSFVSIKLILVVVEVCEEVSRCCPVSEPQKEGWQCFR